MKHHHNFWWHDPQQWWLDLLGWASHIRVELSCHWYRSALVSLWDAFKDLSGITRWEEVENGQGI